MGYVFVSYHRSDVDYVDRLVTHLEAAGVEVWIDRGDIQPGARYRRVIEQAINDCDAFLIVLSPRAKTSDWVENELDWAEQQGKPIYSLLLEGRSWFGLTARHYEDVAGATLPSQRLIDLLPTTNTTPDDPDTTAAAGETRAELLKQELAKEPAQRPPTDQPIEDRVTQQQTTRLTRLLQRLPGMLAERFGEMRTGTYGSTASPRPVKAWRLRRVVWICITAIFSYGTAPLKVGQSKSPSAPCPSLDTRCRRLIHSPGYLDQPRYLQHKVLEVLSG
jgi:hypothetical protein